MYTNLFDAEARVAAIYPISLIGDPEFPPKWVIDFADNLDNEYIADIVSDMPELEWTTSADAYSMSEKERAMAIAFDWQASGRDGLIVHFEVCMRRYLKVGSSFVSGWGAVYLCWAHADTVDEISGKVLAIATQIHEAAKARAGAA